MGDPSTGSVAFQQALLKSERLRIRIVLGTISAALLLRTIRALIVGGHENLSSWLVMGELLGWFF